MGYENIFRRREKLVIEGGRGRGSKTRRRCGKGGIIQKCYVSFTYVMIGTYTHAHTHIHTSTHMYTYTHVRTEIHTNVHGIRFSNGRFAYTLTSVNSLVHVRTWLNFLISFISYFSLSFCKLSRGSVYARYFFSFLGYSAKQELARTRRDRE